MQKFFVANLLQLREEKKIKRILPKKSENAIFKIIV